MDTVHSTPQPAETVTLNRDALHAIIAQRDALAAALRQVDQAAPEIEVNLLPGVVDDWRQLADVVRAALAGVRS